METIDLKSEVERTLATPRCKYSVLSKLFFLSMDLMAGRKTTVPKVIFLEMLASIPYRKWETRHYVRLSFAYRHKSVVELASHMVEWSREAQDNEYWHLLVLNERRKEFGIPSPWYLNAFVTHVALYGYMAFAWFLSRVSMRQALLFNAQFEDHAEHTYAEFVRDHELLFQQPVTNEMVRRYADVATWGEIFARIALDEREHRNNSFIEAGKPELVVNM